MSRFITIDLLLIQNLVDLVTETDSALSFHLQKFAVLTETLAANQGTAVLPMNVGRLGTDPNLCYSSQDSPH